MELDGVTYEDLDEVSKEIARERMSEQSQCIRNEVDQYLTDRHVSLTCKTFDVGKWWKGVETTYPILSKLAKDILAVPCSTVASENAFSLGSRVVDPLRASLTPKTVEALVCTSDWLRCAPANFNLYEPPTEDEMVIYHELEELERGEVEVLLEYLGREDAASIQEPRNLTSFVIDRNQMVEACFLTWTSKAIGRWSSGDYVVCLEKEKDA
ncbi:hypothetical protein ACLB2K_063864 [Fragaria x ananassa]